MRQFFAFLRMLARIFLALAIQVPKSPESCIYEVLRVQGRIGPEEQLLAGAQAARLLEKPNGDSRPADAGIAAAHFRPGVYPWEVARQAAEPTSESAPFRQVTASEEASRNRSTLPSVSTVVHPLRRCQFSRSTTWTYHTRGSKSALASGRGSLLVPTVFGNLCLSHQSLTSHHARIRLTRCYS
jgi:hypothetical protein